MSSRSDILQLYKALLRASQQFSNYSFRTYALRRVRDGFKQHKDETNEKRAQQAVIFAKENLDIIKRQATIGKMYPTEKLVIENK